jgi:hypothetical protein
VTNIMRGRTIASVVLIVVAAVLLVGGVVAFYARTEVVDQRAFVDRAEATLGDADVRDVAGREIVVRFVDRGSTDLIAARPLLQSVVDAALTTDPFRRVFRRAARGLNRALFVHGDENVTFDVPDTARVVTDAMRAVSPKLARRIPENLDAPLLRLRERELAARTLTFADRARTLGIVLPLLALAAFVAAIALAPDRRVAVLRAGVAIGAAGALLAIALVVVRARLLVGIHGSDDLTDAEMRSAVGGVFDAYLADLRSWALAIGLFGLVVAGAAAALDPVRPTVPTAPLRRLLDRPQTPARRAVRGIAVLALGVFAVSNPWLALQVTAIALGAFLVFFGATELLALLPRRAPTRASDRKLRARALATAGVAALVAVGGATALILTATSGQESAPATAAALPTRTCNGSAALCGLRLNEVVFAGTHNSFSAADSPGWYIADQRRTIPRQLRDGVRLFLIDTHWGVGDASGRVRTDFEAEGSDRNKVAAAMPPAQLRAAERVAGRLGVRGTGEGKRAVWLCHTVCELGATKLLDALEDYRRFLDAHRGEVIIVFVEPYVAPAEFAGVAKQAGLDRYVATLDRDEALPTLGELVRTNKRVIVFAEQDADGTVPWYLDGFSFVQDTPYQAKTRGDLSCRLYRGTADSPLLMLNQWADVFPPSLRANKPFLEKHFIIDRAHRCARERGQPVNLIAVDHYDQGDLIAAVNELNAERVKTAKREQRELAADAPG